MKTLFENDDLIKCVCRTIDDIIKGYTLSRDGDGLAQPYTLAEEARLVVLGDFLFSMTSCDLHDPANIIFKTSRSDYMDRIVVRSLVNMHLDYDPFIYLEIHKKLLIGLKIDGVISKSIIRNKKSDC